MASWTLLLAIVVVIGSAAAEDTVSDAELLGALERALVQEPEPQTSDDEMSFSCEDVEQNDGLCEMCVLGCSGSEMYLACLFDCMEQAEGSTDERSQTETERKRGWFRRIKNKVRRIRIRFRVPSFPRVPFTGKKRR